MTKISKESAANQEDYGPVVERSEDHDGYRVSFLEFKVDIDSTPLLKGLPNDLCHAPHWGYVLKGRVFFGDGETEEAYEPGDAFYMAPGHTQRAEAGTEYLQISPIKELDEVSAQIMANMQAMQGES